MAVVIRYSALGDVLLTAPFVQTLAETHRVIFVTSPAFVEVVSALPGVDRAVGFGKDGGVTAAFALGRELRAETPDVVFDLQRKLKSIALARAIGARTVPYVLRTPAEAIRSMVGRDTVFEGPHQTVRYHALLSEIGVEAEPRVVHLTPPQRWVSAGNAVLARGGLLRKKLVGLAPFATHGSKAWPLDRFIGVIGSLAPTVAVVVFTPVGTTTAHLEIERALPKHPIIPTHELPLSTAAALLNRCNWLLGVDTGPVHLAALLGIPSVAIFGPTSVQRWGPWPGARAEAVHVGKAELTCMPCSNHGTESCPLGHHRCMQEVTADEVGFALRGLWAPTPVIPLNSLTT